MTSFYYMLYNPSFTSQKREFLKEKTMIRRISKKEADSISRRFEACAKDDEGCKKEAEAENACDALEMEALVDLAVGALAEYGVNEIEYEEGEEPEENEAICADEEGNEVGVEVKGKTLKIDLDEDEDIVVKLDQPVDDVKAEIKADLEEKMAEQEEAEECNRRFEAWKRERKLRKEGKRISSKSRR